MSALGEVSDAWFQERYSREKSFSLGFFDSGYARRFPAGMVRFQGNVMAFATTRSGAGHG